MTMHARYKFAAFLLLMGMVALNVPGLFGQSPTVDEYAHVPSGYSYLAKGDFRLYPKNPPLIKMFCALPLGLMGLNFPNHAFHGSLGAWGPWRFADELNRRNVKKTKRIYAYARMMNMLLGAALGLLVFVWGSSYYGPRAGLAAMAFTVTSPTILAHTGVATVDVGFTLFFLLSLYTLLKGHEFSTYGRLIAGGVALGAAQLSKFSALILIPVAVLISIIMGVRLLLMKERIKDRPKPGLRKIVMGEIICLTVIFLVAFLVIHFGYFFRKSAIKLEGTVRASKIVKKISETPVAKVPLPLPEFYVLGIDRQLADVERGEFPNYLNGKWRRKGTWYYFLEAILLKETLPSLMFIILGLSVVCYRRIKGKKTIDRRALVPMWPFVHLPALLFLAVISFSGNLQLGVRYAMPILPLFFIAAGAMLFEDTFEVPVIRREKGSKLGLVVSDEEDGGRGYGRLIIPAAVLLLFGWQSVEILRTTPNYLSYFNQIAGGADGGPRYLLDSNVDWGQDLPALSRKMKELGAKEIGLLYFGHADPDLYGIKWHLPRPDDKYVAVSVNFLHGYPYALSYADKWKKRPPMITDKKYAGLRATALSLAKYRPVARAGGSIYIYDVKALVE